MKSAWTPGSHITVVTAETGLPSSRDMNPFPAYSLPAARVLFIACKIVLVASILALFSGCVVAESRHRAYRPVVVEATPPPPPIVVASAPADELVLVPPPPPRHEVVLERERPSARHVWIYGYWAWRDGRHVWIAGHWEVPPHPYDVWVAPRWEHRGKGYVFISGHWR